MVYEGLGLGSRNVGWNNKLSLGFGRQGFAGGAANV